MNKGQNYLEINRLAYSFSGVVFVFKMKKRTTRLFGCLDPIRHVQVGASAREFHPFF